MNKYEGIRICIQKHNIDYKCQKNIEKFFSDNSVIDLEDGVLNLKFLLLVFAEKLNIHKFKKSISKLCINNKIYCHVILLTHNEKIIFIVEFSQKIRYTNITKYINTSIDSNFYHLSNQQHKNILSIIQYDTYEQMYLESNKTYIDKRMGYVQSLVVDVGDRVCKDVKEYHTQILEYEIKLQEYEIKLQKYEKQLQQTEIKLNNTIEEYKFCAENNLHLSNQINDMMRILCHYSKALVEVKRSVGLNNNGQSSHNVLPVNTL